MLEDLVFWPCTYTAWVTVCMTLAGPTCIYMHATRIIYYNYIYAHHVACSITVAIVCMCYGYLSP